MIAQVVVEPAENFHAAINQRRVDAEPVEDISELDCDIPTALDDDGLRQLVQMKGAVGGYAVFMAGKRVVKLRTPADRDQDMICSDCLSCCFEQHLMARNETRPGLVDRHAGIFQSLAVKPFQARDFLILPDGSSLSYDDIHRLSGRLANLLTAQGVKPGDRVAVQVQKSPEALALYLPLTAESRADRIVLIRADARPD